MDGDSNYGMYNPRLNEAGAHLLPVSRHPARLRGALCPRLPRHLLLGLTEFSDDRPLDLVSSRWLRRRSVLRHLGIRHRSIRFRRDRPARYHWVSQTILAPPACSHSAASLSDTPRLCRLHLSRAVVRQNLAQFTFAPAPGP